MATLQIPVEDAVKKQADSLFASLGLDTPSAVRIFLKASIEQEGIPFSVRHEANGCSLQEAVSDSRTLKNLHGPFDRAEEAVAAMLEA
ncbi:MAG: type II toxin-antitoxin system RelB/DinJ family antitoxin [Treponema sp.]|nr:type II toxin-antitoxin system RelB/DinJ family antitoxin [Treponema sp.]